MITTSVSLVGRVFTRLTVTEYVGSSKHQKRMWRCLCECGKYITTDTGALTTGNTKSCGCYGAQMRIDATKTHGMCRTPEYKSWCLIKTRCLNVTNDDYPLYGGRGITMCQEWQDSFEKFIAYVGKRPGRGYSIDRIDVNGNYEPGNVRWATQKDQCRNKRNNHNLTYNGETMPISAWADRTGISQRTIRKRVAEYGWDAEKALTTPIKR